MSIDQLYNRFTNQLIDAFKNGLVIDHDDRSGWYTTLIAYQPDPSQVETLINASSYLTFQICEPYCGSVYEERDRKLFLDNGSATVSDIRLVYTFQCWLSLEENFELFREFICNEMLRLGYKPGIKRSWYKPLSGLDQIGMIGE